jgi:hypothetical protein
MSIETMRQAADTLEIGLAYPGMRFYHDNIRAAIAALRTAIEQAYKQEPVGWPCLIAEADFSQNTVTLAMQCEDYKVSAGQHWLYTTPPATAPVQKGN